MAGTLQVCLVSWLVSCVAVSLVSAASLGIRQMVPVRELQDQSLCRYDVVVDHDPTRVPNRVDKVLCRKDGCKCLDAGDFHCTQLYTQLNVSYTVDPKSVQYDVLDVELACVCARSTGGGDIQSIEPDIV